MNHTGEKIKEKSAFNREDSFDNRVLRAVKNWYEGRRVPGLGHFLLLAQSSPAILKFILEQIGGKDLWETYQLFSGISLVIDKKTKHPVYSDNSVAINVPLNVPIKLDRRQKWFLMLLKSGKRGTAEDIAREWQVSVITL